MVRVTPYILPCFSKAHACFAFRKLCPRFRNDENAWVHCVVNHLFGLFLWRGIWPTCSQNYSHLWKSDHKATWSYWVLHKFDWQPDAREKCRRKCTANSTLTAMGRAEQGADDRGMRLRLQAFSNWWNSLITDLVPKARLWGSWRMPLPLSGGCFPSPSDLKSLPSGWPETRPLPSAGCAHCHPLGFWMVTLYSAASPGAF